MPILPIVIGAAVLVAIAMSRKSEAPAPALTPGHRIGFVWREAEVRAAMCAAYAQGVTDEQVLAKVAGDAIWPGRSWPPTSTASTRQKVIWDKLQASAREAIGGACA